MRKLFEKIIFRIKLMHMDSRWRMMGGSCFALFPPSFYYTHTPEEIERITKEEIAEIRKLLEEYINNNLKSYENGECIYSRTFQ